MRGVGARRPSLRLLNNLLLTYSALSTQCGFRALDTRHLRSNSKVRLCPKRLRSAAVDAIPPLDDNDRSSVILMSKASLTLQVVLASALAIPVTTALPRAASAVSPKDQSKSAAGDSPAKKPASPATTARADKGAITKTQADIAAANKPAPTTEEKKSIEPANIPDGVPPVILTKQHANLCRVKVGDSLPAIELPTATGGKKTKLADLYGKAATVVVFWAGDREMSHLEMADLADDVIGPFGPKGVAVVGVAVKEKPDQVAAALKEIGKDVPMLVDDKGSAFAQVGSRRLPRTFLLDSHGKIIWFDIEYSHATRRELQQALAATVH